MNLKNCLKTKWVISTIFAFVFTIVFHDFFLSKNHILQFCSECNRELEYQVFWTEKPEERFCERKSTRKKVSKGKHFVEIDVPATRLHHIRLDTGSQPGIVRIKDLAIHGAETIVLNGANFTPSGIKTFEAQGKGILITSSSKDPFIIYRQPVNSMEGKFTVSYGNLFLILLSAFYLCYVLCDIWNNRKEKQRTKSTSTLLNIEFLRCMFTLFVLYRHFTTPFGIWNAGGLVAVQFFFMLSGYLLWLTYSPGKKLLDIAKQRWIRFVPLIVFGGLLTNGQWKSFEGCLLLQNTGLFPDVPNSPSWYIAVLFWCTLFYISLIKLLPKNALLFTVTIIGFISTLPLVHISVDRLAFVANFIPISLMRGLSSMSMGIVLASICKRSLKEQINPKQGIIYTMAEVVVLCYVVLIVFNRHVFSENYILVPVSCGFLLILFVKKRGYLSSMFEKKVFGLLARYSLAIYLTHSMFQTSVFRLVSSHFPGWMQQHIGLSVTIAIIGSCIVGVLAHHLVEKPCTRYLTRFFAWMKDGNIRNESKL